MYEISILLEREYHNQVLDKRQLFYEKVTDYSFSSEDAMFSLIDGTGETHFFPYSVIRKIGVKDSLTKKVLSGVDSKNVKQII